MRLDTSVLKSLTVKKNGIEYKPNAIYAKKNGAYYKVWSGTHTVTWLNYDGSVLQTQEIEDGASATYSGSVTPSRPQTTTYYYTWSGWNQSTTSVTADMTISPTFTQNYREYSVSVSGSNILSTGTGTTFHYGDTYTVVVSSSSNYYISSATSGYSTNSTVSVNQSNYASKITYTGTVTGNKTLSITTTRYYKFDVGDGLKRGKITFSNGSVRYMNGVSENGYINDYDGFSVNYSGTLTPDIWYASREVNGGNGEVGWQVRVRSQSGVYSTTSAVSSDSDDNLIMDYSGITPSEIFYLRNSGFTGSCSYFGTETRYHKLHYTTPISGSDATIDITYKDSKAIVISQYDDDYPTITGTANGVSTPLIDGLLYIGDYAGDDEVTFTPPSGYTISPTSAEFGDSDDSPSSTMLKLTVVQTDPSVTFSGASSSMGAIISYTNTSGTRVNRQKVTSSTPIKVKKGTSIEIVFWHDTPGKYVSVTQGSAAFIDQGWSYSYANSWIQYNRSKINVITVTVTSDTTYTLTEKSGTQVNPYGTINGSGIVMNSYQERYPVTSVQYGSLPSLSNHCTSWKYNSSYDYVRVAPNTSTSYTQYKLSIPNPGSKTEGYYITSNDEGDDGETSVWLYVVYDKNGFITGLEFANYPDDTDWYRPWYVTYMDIYFY